MLLKEFYQVSITVYSVHAGNKYDQFAEVFGARNGTLRDSHAMCLLFCLFCAFFCMDCVHVYVYVIGGGLHLE